MGAVGNRYNNPGDLTVTGPNSFLYQGQTGVYNSPNGLHYAIFDSPQSGASALNTYINDNVGSSPNLLNNLSQFTGWYLNGNPDALNGNNLNPYPQSYLKTLMTETGLGPYDPIPQSAYPALARGVSKAEGTYGVFGDLYGSGGGPLQVSSGPGAPVGAWSGNPLEGGFDGFMQREIAGAGVVISAITGKTVPNQGMQITPGDAHAAIAGATGIDLSGITAGISQFNRTLSGVFSKDVMTRVAVVALALIVLIGALILLGKQPTIIQTGATA